MKQFKLAAAILMSASLFSPAAFAQISLKGEAMPVVAASYNWTGFYAGLNAGVMNRTLDMTDNQGTSFFATIQQVSNPAFTGGFQLGYRYQLDPIRISGVYGLEFSADYANASYNKTYGSPFAFYHFNSQNELKDLYLLQLIGGIAANRTLLFLAAGLSWTNIHGNVTNLDNASLFNSFIVNNTIIGTAVGTGIEYAFTDNISARLKIDAIKPNTYSTSDGTGNHFQISNCIVQGTFGVNYKFA